MYWLNHSIAQLKTCILPAAPVNVVCAERLVLTPEFMGLSISAVVLLGRV